MSLSSSSLLQSRRTLYVGGLAPEVQEATVRAALIPFGPIKGIEIPLDYKTSANKGFAFVEFQDADDAADAIDNMDGAELMGKTLNVSLAKPHQMVDTSKAVWSTDEWFQQQAGFETAQQAQQREAQQLQESQLKQHVAMP
jgi:peptidyl-prolyl isomerase E (cyclophilin E)